MEQAKTSLDTEYRKAPENLDQIISLWHEIFVFILAAIEANGEISKFSLS